MSDEANRAKETQADKEVGHYERLAERTREILASSKDKSSELIDNALETARDQLEKAGEFTQREGERARDFLRRDLEATRDDFKKASSWVGRTFHPSRIGGGFLSLASHAFESLGETFQGWAKKSEGALTFQTGEITSPGTLTCVGCGAELHPERTARIPPCPKCHRTEFRKSY